MSAPACSTRWLRVLLLLGIGLAGAVLFFFDPARSWFYPHCLFHTITGLHCPGCGSLRALHALLHGQVAQALGLNPLILIGAPIVTYLMIRQRVRPGAPSPLSWPSMAWVVPGVLILYWIVRNLPFAPFTSLAPR